MDTNLKRKRTEIDDFFYIEELLGDQKAESINQKRQRTEATKILAETLATWLEAAAVEPSAEATVAYDEAEPEDDLISIDELLGIMDQNKGESINEAMYDAWFDDFDFVLLEQDCDFTREEDLAYKLGMHVHIQWYFQLGIFTCNRVYV